MLNQKQVLELILRELHIQNELTMLELSKTTDAVIGGQAQKSRLDLQELNQIIKDNRIGEISSFEDNTGFVRKMNTGRRGKHTIERD